MAELLTYSSMASRLGVPILLFAIAVIVGFFYRKDFMVERRNGNEDRKWARHNQEMLMKLVESDIASREKASEVAGELATSITGLREYLKGRLQ